MDTRMYPQGKGVLQERYVKDVLVQFGVVQTARTRVMVAQLNAGFNLLPALPGVRWRMIDAMLIAVGGAATTGTSVNITGTVAGAAVNLWIVTVAALTRSTPIYTGVTPAVGAQTLLADGASFTQMDANTAVGVITVGAAMTVMTALDVMLSYVADVP